MTRWNQCLKIQEEDRIKKCSGIGILLIGLSRFSYHRKAPRTGTYRSDSGVPVDLVWFANFDWFMQTSHDSNVYCNRE